MCGYVVRPLSSADIRRAAAYVRKMSKCVSPQGKMDVIKLLESVYGQYSIIEDEELPDAYAMTDMDGQIILTNTTYQQACADIGRARFTIAHELGHVVLGHYKSAGARRSSNGDTKPYCDSEWQANEFAGNLLLPPEMLLTDWKLSDDQLAKKYGVSIECAQVRRQKIGPGSYIKNYRVSF